MAGKPQPLTASPWTREQTHDGARLPGSWGQWQLPAAPEEGKDAVSSPRQRLQSPSTLQLPQRCHPHSVAKSLRLSQGSSPAGQRERRQWNMDGEGPCPARPSAAIGFLCLQRAGSIPWARSHTAWPGMRFPLHRSLLSIGHCTGCTWKMRDYPLQVPQPPSPPAAVLWSY